MSKIRYATINDLPAIVKIYNQAVRRGFQTADTEPLSVEDRKEWLLAHTPEDYPIYIFEQNGKILGWISLSPYRKGRKALRQVAEVSYYIEETHQRQGIGSSLMAHVINQMPGLNLRSLIAILLDVNDGSIGLLEKFGFEKWAHLPHIADFGGKQCGQFFYGYQIKKDRKIMDQKKYRYHHIGIPTIKKHKNEKYFEKLKFYHAGYEESEFGIEWMRFEEGCPLPDLVKKLPHPAFEVDDLDEAIQGRKIIIPPNSPSEGIRVAFIEEEGAPIELLEDKS